MKYKRGDIVVVKFPFTINSGKEIQKGRPALVIYNNQIESRYNDIILSAITSQIPENIMELELLIEPDTVNGLLKRSLLRLDFIMTIPENLISRKIGELALDMLAVAENKIKKSLSIK